MILNVILLIIMLSSATVFGQADIANLQYEFAGARFKGIGETSPAIAGDITGIYLNPATIARNKEIQGSFLSQRLMSAYDYTNLSVSVPFRSYNLGVSYGTLITSGIIRTNLVNNRIQSMGSFSSGFRVLQGTVARPIPSLFSLHDVSIGLNAKLYQQFVGNDTRNGLGFDAGIQGTVPYKNRWIDSISIGASMINAFSKFQGWNGHSGSSQFKRDILLGMQLGLMNGQLQTFIQTHPDESLSVGSEYYLNDALSVRLGTDLNNQRVGAGTSIHINNMTQFGTNLYALRIDYNYSAITDHSDLYTHTLSLALLGNTGQQRPVISMTKPDLLIKQDTYPLSGYAQSDSDILIYTNDTLVKTVRTNSNGQWQCPDYPLKEGSNTITVKSYSLKHNYSRPSAPLTILVDLTAPTLKTAVSVDGSTLTITAQSDEPLKTVLGTYMGETILFQSISENEYSYQLRLPKDYQSGAIVPSILQPLEIWGIDLAENRSANVPLSFFVSVAYPKDKATVYKQFTTIIGRSSNAIQSLSINNLAAQVDVKNQFSVPVYLKPGKNTVEIQAKTHTDQLITYYLRIKSLKTYKDVSITLPEKQAIEQISSIGISISKTPQYYYPHRTMSRIEFGRFLVKLKRIPLESVSVKRFKDVDYQSNDGAIVETLLAQGWISQKGKREFGTKPDMPERHAIYALIKAGLLTDEHLILAKRDTSITRKRLAVFLTHVPAFQEKLKLVSDW